jgi:hypothetical protein
MMFGGSVLTVAPPMCQGTESVAAAAAMMIYILTAIGLSVYQTLKNTGF